MHDFANEGKSLWNLSRAVRYRNWFGPFAPAKSILSNSLSDLSLKSFTLRFSNRWLEISQWCYHWTRASFAWVLIDQGPWKHQKDRSWGCADQILVLGSDRTLAHDSGRVATLPHNRTYRLLMSQGHLRDGRIWGLRTAQWKFLLALTLVWVVEHKRCYLAFGDRP